MPEGDKGDAEGIPNGSTMYSRPPPMLADISRGIRGLSEPSRLSRWGFSQRLSCLRDPRHRLNESIPKAPTSSPTTMPPTPPIAAGTTGDEWPEELPSALWFMLRHAVSSLEPLCNGPCAHTLFFESATEIKNGNPWESETVQFIGSPFEVMFTGGRSVGATVSV